MGSPAIFKGAYAYLLASAGLKFKDNVAIVEGGVDPTVTPVDALAGSVYVSTLTKRIYTKKDNGSTINWTILLESSDAYTSVALNTNGSPKTILDVSTLIAGQGGQLVGTLTIDGVTDYVFTFVTQFTKPLTGTGYESSTTFGAGTVPVGTAVTITTAGLIQVTVPVFTGSGTARFVRDGAAGSQGAPGVVFDDYKFTRGGRDADGIYVTVEYFRADSTLYRKSVLSGGSAPLYPTRTITYYALDGITPTSTTTFTLTYSGGELVSES